MSQIYTIARPTIMEWGLLGTTPAGITLQVCGVNDDYVFSAAHTVEADLAAGVIAAAQLVDNHTYVGRIIDGDDTPLLGVTPGATLAALVVFLEWAGGTLLLAYIDQSSNGSIPAVFLTPEGEIIWNASGIMRL